MYTNADPTISVGQLWIEGDNPESIFIVEEVAYKSGFKSALVRELRTNEEYIRWINSGFFECCSPLADWEKYG